MTNGGKTTLTNSLLNALPNCCVIHQDDFFKVAALARGSGVLARATLPSAAHRPAGPGTGPSHVMLGQGSEGQAFPLTEHLLCAWHVLTRHLSSIGLIPAPGPSLWALQAPRGPLRLPRVVERWKGGC